MPIKIFEPRSAISRIVDIYSFAPKHLNQAAKITDHLERFKLVIAFALSGVYLTTS
jgi:Oxysterol-binding protein